MNKNPLENKSIEELVNEAMLFLASEVSMTMEQEMEDDADGGYFEED